MNISIPYITNFPLKYVFENMKLIHKHDTLWLEFGVFQGRTINYISSFTNDKVYGFDCFNGLPEKWIDGFEKGTFDLNGQLPRVKENVILIKGLFQDTLTTFLNSMNKKVSFVHIDCDLYSSTKNSIKCQMRILNKKRIAGVPSTTVVTRVRHKSRGVNYIVLCSLRHRRGKVWANIFGLLEKK